MSKIEISDTTAAVLVGATSAWEKSPPWLERLLQGEGGAEDVELARKLLRARIPRSGESAQQLQATYWELEGLCAKQERAARSAPDISPAIRRWLENVAEELQVFNQKLEGFSADLRALQEKGLVPGYPQSPSQGALEEFRIRWARFGTYPSAPGSGSEKKSPHRGHSPRSAQDTTES